jgi:phospholipid transport system transporter-binding protein
MLRKIDNQNAELSGDLTSDTVVSLLAEGRKLIDLADQRWTLEMAGVGKVSSAAVALLLDWIRYAQGKQVEIGFRSVPGHMLPIVEVSDLEPLFDPLVLSDG